jgi:hypothetical protein
VSFGDDLTGAFLNRGRQIVGLVVFAIRRNLCGVLLQAIVVQDVTVTGRVVVAAHPIADKVPIILALPEPISASDPIHI